MESHRAGDFSRRGGKSGGPGAAGGGRQPKSQQSDADAAPDRRSLRNQANAIVRGGYRKKPRLQNISSFGESLAAGDLIPEVPEVPTSVTFDALREKQREQNEKLLSQLAAQLDGDSDEDIDMALHADATGSQSSLLSHSGEKTNYVIESCQICLDRVRPEQAVWACPSCFCHQFHLYCIKSWINEAMQRINLKELNGGASSVPTRDRVWLCPNCRSQFSFLEAPQFYFCFCGQLRDPPVNPWLEPHSCGEICSRSLACKQHTCTRPCHSGRCGPCAQQLTVPCFCGSSSQRRCSERTFSCGKTCNKPLACKTHFCKQPCHEGTCPPCGQTSKQSCRCGNVNRLQPCAEPTFSCGTICSKRLPCGCLCKEVCHTQNSCPPCPRSLPRPCFCGKKTSKLPCEEEVTSCGSTCGKLLPCGVHRCTSRCHSGECPKCMIYTLKSCRCGKSVKKELPCSQEYRCERKCENSRSCKRHKCHQRCCQGVDCPLCQKTCARPLQCGNHHCQAICHTGPCDPCPRMMTISCTCGTIKEIIPCGRGRTLPHSIHKHCRGHHKDGDVTCGPPKFLDCSSPCGNVLSCGVHRCVSKCHVVNVKRKVERDPVTEMERVVVEAVSETDPSDNCDECSRTCNKPLPFCTHSCPLPCHLNDCDNCQVVVHLSCHCKLEKNRPIVCFDRLDSLKRETILSCGAKCTKQLKYCNHTCSKLCHSGDCDHKSCPKKVSVRCSCKNRKESVTCEAAQKLRISTELDPILDRAELVILKCDETCLQRRAEKKAAREAARAKQSAAQKDDVDFVHESESSSDSENSEDTEETAPKTPVSPVPSVFISSLKRRLINVFTVESTVSQGKVSKESAAQRRKNAARRRTFAYVFMVVILVLSLLVIIYLAKT